MSLKQDERKTLLDRYWQEAESGNQDWRQRADKAFDFYKTKQWDATDVQTLNDEGRPHLSWNIIKPIIRNISGFQRRNRQQTTVKARKRGVAMLAQAWTEVIKDFEDNSNVDWEKSMSAFNGTIGGKGWVGLNVDYSRDPINGDLVLENKDPFAIFEDPNCQSYDLNRDAMYIWDTSWVDKEQAKIDFDIKDEDLAASLQTIHASDKKAIGTGEDHYHKGQTSEANKSPERFKYRLKTCWWKHWEEKRILFNPKTLQWSTDDQVKRTMGDKLKDAIKTFLGKNPEWKEIKRRIQVLNYTVRLGNLELDHIEDPFEGVCKFPLVRFASDWVNGHIKGEVEDLQDPQSEVNKRMSQALHHLNQSVNSGTLTDEDTFGQPGTSSWDDLEKYGSKPGVNLKRKKGSHFERLKPGDLSGGHLTLGQFNQGMTRTISGVNPDLTGEETKHPESGIAKGHRITAGLVTTEIIHDNWRYTEKIIGETILDFLINTDVISAEEIAAIVQESNLTIDPAQVKEALKDRKIGRYGVTVALSPTSVTAREESFGDMVEIARAGIPIPPEMVIEQSQLPEAKKEEAKQFIQAQRGQGQPQR